MPSAGEEHKIDKYDAVLVKATLSDAIGAYLSEKKGFKQDFRLANLKLGVGLICCLCALVAQFYPKPFPANYWVLVACAVV
jgi:signal peptidase complex subunit 2